jgi:hypothetical protein
LFAACNMYHCTALTLHLFHCSRLTAGYCTWSSDWLYSGTRHAGPYDIVQRPFRRRRLFQSSRITINLLGRRSDKSQQLGFTRKVLQQVLVPLCQSG